VSPDPTSLLARLGLGLALDPERLLAYGALGAARVVPVFTIAPFFGGRLVPATVRVAIAVTFVALVFPAVTAGAPGSPLAALGPLGFGALLVKEVVLGALLGWLAAMPFWAAEAAGRLVDTARGAANQELYVPQLGTPSSPLGDLSLQLAVVVFFAVDGHLLFLRALAASYEALPVLAAPPGLTSGAIGALALAATSHLVLAALGLAAPVLAALLLADLALGLVNRVSPHVQVYFLGMPAKAVLGVLVFLLALSGLATALRGEIGLMLHDLARAVGR
jgi:type III secretion protein SpaR/YscT/HrcT